MLQSNRDPASSPPLVAQEQPSPRELAAEANAEIRRQAWEIAVAADRKKDVFIAILAHELRNLLAPVRVATAILKQDGISPAQLKSSSLSVERQVGSMARLIDDLLDVARLRLGEFELRRRQTAVADLIDRNVETLRALVLSYGNEFIVSVSPDSMMVLADVMRVSQVLHNLVSNAAKYTNRGGQIRITASRDADDAVITVSDTGIGITASQREAIFDMYAQAGQADSARSEGGLGIGLYLARRLVEAHGGSIRATSKGRNRGSEFTVRLPCS